jgi:hypothetical protein
MAIAIANCSLAITHYTAQAIENGSILETRQSKISNRKSSLPL